MTIFKASLSAVCTILVCYCLPMFFLALVEGLEFMDALAILLSMSFTLGIVVFLFSFVFLVPLVVLFRFLSRSSSFIVFLSIGFSIPIIVIFKFFSGVLPRLLEIDSSSGNHAALIGVLPFGFMGLLASLASWLYLHIASKPPNKSNQPGTFQSNAPV